MSAAAAALALGGCVEQAVETSPDVVARAALERAPGVSFKDATVAIVSVVGAPPDVAASFKTTLRQDAEAREIALTDARTAHYLVRGYLSATAAEGGADVEYVWDVFGPDKRREFRLNDVISVKGTGDDPWAMVTTAALDSVAAKSADDLAAFLSHAPEAKPATSAALGQVAAE
jgi:hypothetical protein